MAKDIELQIEGMTCGHCAMSVSKELAKLAGASEIQVDPRTGRATLKVDEGISTSDLNKAVDESGYKLVAIHE